MRSAGFTLLEIMVVVVIIGIIATFAVLQLRPNDPAEQVYHEARRLQAVLQQQLEEAILLGQQRGLRFAPQQYRVLQLSEDRTQWLAQVDEQALPSRALDQVYQINLAIEGRPIAFNNTSNNPHIVLLSSGEATEFELVLRSTQAEDVAYQIHGQLTGEVTLSALP